MQDATKLAVRRQPMAAFIECVPYGGTACRFLSRMELHVRQRAAEVCGAASGTRSRWLLPW